MEQSVGYYIRTAAYSTSLYGITIGWWLAKRGGVAEPAEMFATLFVYIVATAYTTEVVTRLLRSKLREKN